jgi:hypothetical protein
MMGYLAFSPLSFFIKYSPGFFHFRRKIVLDDIVQNSTGSSAGNRIPAECRVMVTGHEYGSPSLASTAPDSYTTSQALAREIISGSTP